MTDAPVTPKLAAFPKAFMDELCVHKTMTVFEWIDLASTLDIDGLEFYAGFCEGDNPAWISSAREALAAKNLAMPMLCCSPDFTADDLAGEVEKERGWMRAHGGARADATAGCSPASAAPTSRLPKRREHAWSGRSREVSALLLESARRHADHREPLQRQLLDAP